MHTTHTHTHTHTQKHTLTYTHMHTHIHKHTQTHRHTHIHTFVYRSNFKTSAMCTRTWFNMVYAFSTQALISVIIRDGFWACFVE